MDDDWADGSDDDDDMDEGDNDDEDRDKEGEATHNDVLGHQNHTVTLFNMTPHPLTWHTFSG